MPGRLKWRRKDANPKATPLVEEAALIATAPKWMPKLLVNGVVVALASRRVIAKSIPADRR